MSFFSNLTKFIVSPVTLTLDALSAGQLEASKNTFEMIDEAYGAARSESVVQPIIQINAGAPAVPSTERSSMIEGKFDRMRESASLSNDAIIAEKRWSNGVITRWSEQRVYSFTHSGWTWTYRNPSGSSSRTDGARR